MIITCTPHQKKTAGRVAFVGAGPGDPGLLTLRAVELLAAADVVVLDRLVQGEAVLRHCPPDTEVIDPAVASSVVAGPDGASGTLPGTAMSGTAVPGTAMSGGDPPSLTLAARGQLVVEAARAGRSVVRLVDGDPGLYGGMWEEASACASAGIPFEIVPGVSPVTGVPEYAGIPLTTSATREVRVVDAADPSANWACFGAGDATLVLLGAVEVIDRIADELAAAGRRPETPVAVTHAGTTTGQRTVVSTLDRVAADVKAAGMEPPGVLVVGDVVELRDTLSWFETKPLFGWRVLVPRTREQAGALSVQLRSYGAIPQEVPTIAVERPRTPQQMDRAVQGLVTGRYEWVAFTSTNAVKAVREKFEQYGLDARAFAGLKIAAVGEQTAGALAAWGIKPDLVPSGQQSSEGLLEDWPAYDSLLDPINRVFLPRADIATDTLVAGLQEFGWEVDDVTAYRTVRAAPPPAPIREAIKGGGFDAVLFTSSSTVRNLVGIAGKPHATTVIACIGPQTAKTVEEHGLRVDVMAPTPSVGVLVEALAEYGAAQRLAAIQAGEPVHRPSEKKATARRKAR